MPYGDCSVPRLAWARVDAFGTKNTCLYVLGCELSVPSLSIVYLLFLPCYQKESIEVYSTQNSVHNVGGGIKLYGKHNSGFWFPLCFICRSNHEIAGAKCWPRNSYALEVKRCKTGQEAYATVQFIDIRGAELIISLAQQRLYYGSSYLRAWEMPADIVPRPRNFVHQMMEQIVLSFGCQTSKNKFSVLWKKENVSVKFGIGMKKMYFMFKFLSVDYKLELSYESIWLLILYCPRGQASKLLLIQERARRGGLAVLNKLVVSIFRMFQIREAMELKV